MQHRRQFLAVLGTGTLVGLAGCEHAPVTTVSGETTWPLAGYDAQNTNQHPTARGPHDDASPTWIASTYGRINATPVTAPETVYIGDNDGGVHAVSRETGETQWQTSIHGGVNGLAVSTDTLYVSSYRLHALDRETGDERWQWRVRGFMHQVADGHITTPILSDDTVYVGSHDDGTVAAVNAVTGATRWQTTVEGIAARPAVADGTVYMTTGTDVVGLDAATGDRTHEFTLDDVDARTAPTVADGHIYIGASPFTAVCFGIGKEQVVWRRDGVNPHGSCAVANGRVFIGDSHDGVYALNALTGETEWQTGMPGIVRRSPVVVDGTVYAASKGNQVAAFDAATGETEWTHDNGDTIRVSPVVVDGTVIYGDLTGVVTALAGSSSSRPIDE